MAERPERETGIFPKRIVVPVTRIEQVDWLLPPALALARAQQARVHIRYLVEVQPGRALSEAAGETMRVREALNKHLSNLHLQEPVQTSVRVVREAWEGIWEAAASEPAHILLFAWDASLLPRTAQSRLQDPRLISPPCDLVVFKPGTQWANFRGWPPVRHILLPLEDSPHSVLALQVADALAEALDAHISVLLVVPSHQTDGQEAEDRLRAVFGPTLRELPRVARTIVVEGELSPVVLEEAKAYPLLVMGSSVSTRHWLEVSLLHVAESTEAAVLLTRKAQPQPEPPRAPLVAVSRSRYHPITVLVDKWFAENTFHSREFDDLHELVRLKERQGVTISLGLPALNEEETIGNVIDTMKRALMDEVPLLDEIVLIDSGSVDYTREIAASKGIPVYIHQEVLPQYGAYHGKGEALWKSLYVLKGDIIVWIDTDIRNPHPRFVYGVLGPLLKYPHIQYVKGFYRRPLKQGEKMVAGGGGRVTELTARPLLNLFFPELSGFIQPLSGEYAGRRKALEQVPFFTGYGVETGLLIDILEHFGLSAMAQVDLVERIHRNKPLQALSTMAFAIIQVVVRRLEERRKIHLLEDFNKTMNLIRYEPGRYFLETVEIQEHERPPMAHIPEYRAKFGLPAETPTAAPMRAHF